MLPSRYQLWAWAGIVLACLLLQWQELPLSYAWGLLGLWVLCLAFAAFLLWRETPQFYVQRDYGKVQQSGEAFEMVLHLHHQMRRSLSLQVFDHYPSVAEVATEEMTLQLPAQTQASLRYGLCIQSRGRFVFTQLQLRYTGWGIAALWQRDLHLPCEAEVRVYPRFAHQQQESLRSIGANQLGQVRPLHLRSGNGDFSHLRDYLPGDAIARLDHKARARMNKWLVREYEFEHEQPVLLLLDASRRMQTRFGERLLFDEVLAAATQLAHSALATGDEVGLQLFADTPLFYLPCSRQSGQYRRIVESLFDRHAQSAPPDYVSALQEAYVRQRRRALMIVLTSLEAGDEVLLRPSLQLLQKRHHVMLVNIRPPYLDTALPVDKAEQVFVAAARDVYAQAVAEMESRLKQGKLIFLSTTPAQLCPQLLNAYMAYKNHLKH